MPAKKSGDDGARKSSTSVAEPKPPKPTKPIEPEITVQNLPKPPETPETTNTERKNFLAIPDEDENPFTYAEEHLISVLRKLQELHDTACETNAMEVVIERTTFTKIATTIQKTWHYVKAAKRVQRAQGFR